MSIISAIAIYFIIWWTVLFAVLPFGVKNSHEAGTNVEEGHEPGAPVKSNIAKKMLATTAVAAIIYILVYTLIASNLLEGLDLPFFNSAPKI
jgi:predicted secreted protein